MFYKIFQNTFDMGRQEDFIEAGIQYRMEHGRPMAIGGGNFSEMAKEMNRVKPFEAGAEYGYQYAVEKALQWIDDNVLEFKGESFVHDFKDCLQDFRRAMEE